MEFHIARSLRDRLKLPQPIAGFRVSENGNIVFASVSAARELAAGLTALRLEDGVEAPPVNGGALFAMSLIDELSHAMVARFRKEIDPPVLAEGLQWFEEKLLQAQTATQTAAQTAAQTTLPAASDASSVTRPLDQLLVAFATQFPGTEVFAGRVTPAAWLEGSDGDLSNRESELEELMMLFLANRNPAFAPFRELFADDALQQQPSYTTVTSALPDFFQTRPLVSAASGTLFDVLMAPILASPDSLVGQLDFIREHWTPYLGEDLKRALLAIDLVREEDVAIWMRFHPNQQLAPGQAEMGWEAHGFAGDEYVGYEQDFVVGPDGVRRPRRYASDHQAPLNEYEAFSPDQAWMPTVVMMAKSTYVWLEQLSKKYLRHIHRLDQIPDEELKLLAGRGMTALWLIGLWERSVASRTIKRLRGQADAVASAYSLKEYNIAEDLGGNSAYESLRDRAAVYGIRLASDMVPNHMGIDSPWVIDHPEWFITRDDSPFPVYRFDGPDLSADSRASIKIEDHYYDQTDAAVAFQLHTFRDQRTRFMYHGNDGTTFAWNDTAQLDYSKASVREHIMQTILHVARLFPIIRFDAAMVLAKRHVQRLWFPLPGVGGSIPSRAEYAMSQEEFDALMPNEFWREVVDRVAIEVPGTLLLAEAFWLLEGYFVRTLGMHRVYNSAFMNMLRDEENAKYRSYLKKTVEFDPDILKRYVNFMSNPDEKTAAEQFGSGDKYFGTCTLLATLPGLPMFAHGQIEGFTERYGMDFKEARQQETPDQHLIARYEREITPLLKTRWLFADSTHFVLYDFWTEHGAVDENVFAYSNRSGEHRAVVFYNNAYASTRGTIRISVASVDKGSGELRQRTLDEALAIPGGADLFFAYRDTRSGLEQLERAEDLRERGLTIELGGYQYRVLLDWRELRSTADKPWAELWDSLRGAGVHNLEEALASLRLRPVHEALRGLLSRDHLGRLTAAAVATRQAAPTPEKKQTLSAKPSVSEPSPSPSSDPSSEPASADLAEPSSPQHPALAPIAAAAAHFYSRAALFVPVLEIPAHGASSELPDPAASYADTLSTHLNALLDPETLSRVLPPSAPATAGEPDDPLASESVLAPHIAWLSLASLPASVDPAALFDELHLRPVLANVLSSVGLQGEAAWRAAARIRIALAQRDGSLAEVQTAKFWNDPDVRWLTGAHDAHGSTYFEREPFENLLAWLEATRLNAATPAERQRHRAQAEQLIAAAATSGYNLALFQRLHERSNAEATSTAPPAAKVPATAEPLPSSTPEVSAADAEPASAPDETLSGELASSK